MHDRAWRTDQGGPIVVNMSLVQEFRAYGAWRASLCEFIAAYRRWLAENSLGDAQTDLRLQQLVGRLAEDRVVVAFVAGLPRGKTELINAIFFADYGRHLLHVDTDLFTMSTTCTTELLYNRAKPPCIELLPIETRATHPFDVELRRFPEEWRVVPLDPGSADAMFGAFAKVRETKRVPAEEARRYGLFDPGADDGAAAQSGNDTVEVPCWRHAVINFPHPALEQGLVILDTSGDETIGSPRELAPSLLPGAHALLLILAADSGVTGKDVAIWRAQTSQTAMRGRFAVMTGMSGLRSESGSAMQFGADCARQMERCSRLLEIDASRLFPVSAQEGLLAKIADDDVLLATSGLAWLEQALAAELIPGRQEILCSLARDEIESITGATRSGLQTKRRNVLDQLQKLEYLRGKNRSMIAVMMQKVGSEKESLERVLARYQALRGVLSTHTNRLYTDLAMDALSDDWRRAREEMHRSVFTPGVRSAMARFFRNVRDRLKRSADQAAEISSLMTAMYRKFGDEHGLRLPAPAPFSMLKYLKEIDHLENNYERHFNTLVAMITNEKLTLMQKFFETVASRAKRCYEYANREADQWLSAIVAPMETQVREHQMQLRRRLESIKRIHQATDTLERRIEQLLAVEQAVRTDLETLEKISAGLMGTLEFRDYPLTQAA